MDIIEEIKEAGNIIVVEMRYNGKWKDNILAVFHTNFDKIYKYERSYSKPDNVKVLIFTDYEGVTFEKSITETTKKLNHDKLNVIICYGSPTTTMKTKYPVFIINNDLSVGFHNYSIGKAWTEKNIDWDFALRLLKLKNIING